MAQHGYLREWDEGWGGSDERDRRRNEDRERSGPYRDERDRDHDRGFMLDRDRDDDRGFFDRMGDRARRTFGDDDRHPAGERWSSSDWRGSGQDEWRSGSEGTSGYGRDQRDFGGRSGWERSPRTFGSHQDDQYRSWRDKQMNALDRDYADYCREREQQFHQNFDQWRANRNQQQGGNRMSSTQAVAADQERAHERAMAGQGNMTSPTDAATLGTNNSENSGVGRGKR